MPRSAVHPGKVLADELETRPTYLSSAEQRLYDELLVLAGERNQLGKK